MHWGMITPMYHSYHIHPLFTSIKDNDKDNETDKNNGKEKDNEKTRSFRNHYIPPHHPDPTLLMLLSTCLSMDHWGMMPLKDSEFQRFPNLNEDSSFLCPIWHRIMTLGWGCFQSPMVRIAHAQSWKLFMMFRLMLISWHHDGNDVICANKSVRSCEDCRKGGLKSAQSKWH